jgi:chemotaxis family two-component system response regulator Rcp1
MNTSEISPQPQGQPVPIHDTKPTLLVLHINDSTDDQVLFQTACKHAEVPFIWHVTDSAEKAVSYLDTLVQLDKSHSVRWPDLVVLDVVMPGQSGFSVLEYIRKTPALHRLPVVIFTGHSTPAMVEEAYKLGANSFLAKPANFPQTVELVSSLYAIWSIAQRPTV